MEELAQSDLFGDSTATLALRHAARQRSARSGTFADNLSLPVHRWFRYSAGFSAEWVEHVISEHSGGTVPTVLDPFAGSGTALLAAEKAGAIGYGYESHPFVARIAAAKLLWHANEGQFLDVALKFLDEARKVRTLDIDQPADLLKKCFTPENLAKLSRMRSQYAHSADDSAAWKLIWLAITSILRSCSFVGTAQWQYVLPNKRKAKTLDPFDAFGARAREMAGDMARVKGSGFKNSAQIILHDARRPTPLRPASIDLVVTSPPYPNNYDYADATRLEMTFWREIETWGDLQHHVRQYIVRSCSQHAAAEKLKLDQLLEGPILSPIKTELQHVCTQLAEIRMTKGGRKTYHTMVAAYFADLAHVFAELRSVCRPGGRMCLVVGDSAPYGIHVPVENWLGILAVEAGFKNFSFEKLRDRNVKWKNRKHRVPLHEGRLWIDA